MYSYLLTYFFKLYCSSLRTFVLLMETREALQECDFCVFASWLYGKCATDRRTQIDIWGQSAIIDDENEKCLSHHIQVPLSSSSKLTPAVLLYHGEYTAVSPIAGRAPLRHATLLVINR